GMMSLWDALRMNMMISYQELVRTFPKGYAQGVRAPVFYGSGSEAPKNNKVTSNVDTPSYEASDEKLNAVWKRLSPETRKRLLPSQREWIKQKSACNNEQKCLIDMTNNRIRELESEHGK
ncbi:lysozyme inhibitor LprI family protein, partial [Enterobacter hormaechei]|uniref:lysozyme inhibitor LprI family protein n=1 Tax=Enterobacter hormaechei TaxID=158836 RepID=UPI000A437EB4